MPERDCAGGQFEQGGALGRFEVGGGQSEPFPRAHDDRRVGRVVGRDEHQHPLCCIGQFADPGAEGVLHLPRHGQRFDGQRPAPAAAAGQRGGEFDDGERVSACLGEDPRPHRIGEIVGAPVEQGRRTRTIQSGQRQRVQPGRREMPRALAHGEQHGHRFLPEPAGGEQQGVQRRRIEPVGIIDQAGHRSVPGQLGEQR
ncbi:hypothetical protein [Nocardia wallacei]|uniref:hypothetical protein n=1 Tax=Nocardia wallacei TaxID=480035 RepID=UPI002454B5DA|nr:hypothetical protein [Nocardia wallacei]